MSVDNIEMQHYKSLVCLDLDVHVHISLEAIMVKLSLK